MITSGMQTDAAKGAGRKGQPVSAPMKTPHMAEESHGLAYYLSSFRHTSWMPKAPKE